MGIMVSSHATLSPISLASTILGFISFALTLATFFRVFWENLQTFFNAERESRNILVTLRIELAEETESLREIRRHQRGRDGSHGVDVLSGPVLDDLTLRNMMSSAKRLTRRFEDLEKPFLCDSAELDRRRDAARQRARSRRGRGRSRSVRQNPYRGRGDEPYTNKDYDPEKRDGYVSEGYQDEEDMILDTYTTFDFRQRLAWLRTRQDFLVIVTAVTRLQTRRIARQVGEIACTLQSFSSTLDDMRHAVTVTENRMSRVVGVRRVD